MKTLKRLLIALAAALTLAVPLGLGAAQASTAATHTAVVQTTHAQAPATCTVHWLVHVIYGNAGNVSVTATDTTCGYGYRAQVECQQLRYQVTKWGGWKYAAHETSVAGCNNGFSVVHGGYDWNGRYWQVF